MRGISIPTASAWAAHAMAWAAGGWLAFAPAYQGASQTASLPGEPAGEIVRHTSTLIEQNGLQVVPLLLAPIVLTAIALAGPAADRQQADDAEVLLWGPAALLLGFCVLAILSIGIFYLPAAMALLVAAIAGLGDQKGPRTTT